MPLFFTRQDITDITADAVINFDKVTPPLSGDVEQKIYAVAGCEKLVEARKKLGLIPQGEAKYTEGFGLPAKYVIHAVLGQGVNNLDAEISLLRKSLKNSFDIAQQLGLDSVALALPPGRPGGALPEQKAQVLYQEVRALPKDITVYVAVMEKLSLVAEDVEDKQTKGISESVLERRMQHMLRVLRHSVLGVGTPNLLIKSNLCCSMKRPACEPLSKLIEQRDAGFVECVNTIMIEKNLSNVDVYRKANIDRRMFSKLMNGEIKKPSKNMVLALIVGLRLELSRVRAFMALANYAFNPSDKTDIIVFYNLEKGIYDIDVINGDLFDYGQECLGSKY